MAARIEVAAGPDAGWAYTLLGPEARIGRGAGNQVRLTDPAWPDGALRIQVRQGGYLIANGLPYPVYVDGKPLPPGRPQTLHHGAAVQPTGGTLLRFRVIETPPGPVPEGGVAAEPPAPRAGWGAAIRRRLPVLVLAVAVGLHAYTDLAPARATHAGTAAAAVRHKAFLKSLADDARYKSAQSDANRALARLTNGVFAESEGRYKAACQQYVEARDLLDRIRPGLAGTDAAEPVAAALEFVKSRIDATGGR
jgi:hypothetical protein